MTEVDVVALQLITAACLATSATAVGPAATSAADGSGAAGTRVVMLLLLLMLLGVGPPSLFRRYKTKHCWLDY